MYIYSKTRFSKLSTKENKIVSFAPGRDRKSSCTMEIIENHAKKNTHRTFSIHLYIDRPRLFFKLFSGSVLFASVALNCIK